MENGLFLVNRPKGIHKPKGWQYALSVRQSLDGPYNDHDLEFGEGGAWTYRYYQENGNVGEEDREFTNAALRRNIQDGVPVGVMRQVQRRPDPKYEVLGLALVREWQAGYFLLEQFSLPLISPDEIAPSPAFPEGAAKQTWVNGYERNQAARRTCIEHYGANCIVCKLSFAERYGEIGVGFIHVHHVIPLAHVRHEYEVDPIRDLRPVCPNCHAMLHRVNPPLTIEDLSERLSS